MQQDLAFNPCTYRADARSCVHPSACFLQPLHVQGRHRSRGVHQSGQPSTPARTGQTCAAPAFTGLIPFNPCTYRADRRASQVLTIAILQPLHVQGRPYGRAWCGAGAPSTPARTGQTQPDLFGGAPAPFNPCSHRAYANSDLAPWWVGLQPLHVQGRLPWQFQEQQTIPSTPARTGQTVVWPAVGAGCPFNPCTYRADVTLARYCPDASLQPLHVQGRPWPAGCRTPW